MRRQVIFASIIKRSYSNHYHWRRCILTSLHVFQRLFWRYYSGKSNVAELFCIIVVTKKSVFDNIWRELLAYHYLHRKRNFFN